MGLLIIEEERFVLLQTRMLLPGISVTQPAAAALFNKGSSKDVDPRRRRSAACGIDVGRVVRVVPVGTFMRGICLRRARDRILCSSNLSVAGEALAPA
jgi:hypothetical protein